MSKWTVLIGIAAAAVLVYKLHVEEITFVDVVKFVGDNAFKVEDVAKENPVDGVLEKARESTRLVRKKKVSNKQKSPLTDQTKDLTIMAFGDIML